MFGFSFTYEDNKRCVHAIIGERSEPSSDKLGGEIFSSHALVYLSLNMYVCWPVNQYHAHSHCVCTLIPDIARRKLETES